MFVKMNKKHNPISYDTIDQIMYIDTQIHTSNILHINCSIKTAKNLEKGQSIETMAVLFRFIAEIFSYHSHVDVYGSTNKNHLYVISDTAYKPFLRRQYKMNGVLTNFKRFLYAMALLCVSEVMSLRLLPAHFFLL